MPAAAGEAAHRAVEENQRANARSTARRHVRGPIADAPALGEIEIEVGRRLQQHARSRLAPGIFAPIGANTLSGMIRAMVDGIDGDTVGCEFIAHPAHQGFELVDAVVAAADARLVGDDGECKTAAGKGLRHLENAIDEAAILDAMEILDVLIDDAVAIEKEAAPRHADVSLCP